jgi:hypothetical protein
MPVPVPVLESRIARARPWVWASSSTGRALPRVGRPTDVELRFSYYR